MSRSSSSKTDAPALPESVQVGEVLRPHGVRGEVVVFATSDTPDRFAVGAELRLGRAGGEPRIVRVATVRERRPGLLVIGFEGVADRDGAEALRGGVLEVDRSRVPAPPEGAFYHFELIGCRCRDRASGDLGAIVDMVADGGGWLVIAEREDGQRIALPFVESFLVAIDREARAIEWDLPEGLVETCASRS